MSLEERRAVPGARDLRRSAASLKTTRITEAPTMSGLVENRNDREGSRPCAVLVKLYRAFSGSLRNGPARDTGSVPVGSKLSLLPGSRW